MNRRIVSRLRTLMLLLSGLLLTAVGGNAWGQAATWPIPDWQVVPPDAAGLSAAGVARVGQWLAQHGSKTGLLIRHGRIVGEWYFGDTKPTSKLLVHSVTKSFSSVAVGVAIADGRLALDTTIGQFLPELQPAEKKKITIVELLSMTSGVHNGSGTGDLAEPFAYARLGAPLDASPGERWEYNNTALALLSPVFKTATGQGIDQFLDARVFRPIGITPDDWSWERSADLPLPYSGLHITARALARFGLLMVRSGRWQDQQIVPAEWVTRSAQPSQSLEKSYGYLWWNNTTGKWPGVPADAFAAIGWLHNDMLLVPSLDLVVIRQVGNDSEYKEQFEIGDLFKLAIDAIEDHPPAK
ncbi:MAG TPA: serine hydrolase domain-containing protein [Pirellulales bacterium]|nr:serine hydrolase domain-containing protein [Pirellulales bacterium]